MKTKMKFLVFAFLTLFIGFSSCQRDDDEIAPTDNNVNNNDDCTINFNDTKTYGSVTDHEGNIYKTIVINGKEWMAENLKVSTFINGDAIPNVIDSIEWFNLTTPAFCWNENNTENECLYGKLYNWYVVNDSRGICPSGWHVPTTEEWEQYIFDLEACDHKEAGSEHWKSLSENLNNTNSSGFTALPSGLRNCNSGYNYAIYAGLGYSCFYWSSSEYNDGTNEAKCADFNQFGSNPIR